MAICTLDCVGGTRSVGGFWRNEVEVSRALNRNDIVGDEGRPLSTQPGYIRCSTHREGRKKKWVSLLFSQSCCLSWSEWRILYSATVWCAQHSLSGGTQYTHTHVQVASLWCSAPLFFLKNGPGSAAGGVKWHGNYSESVEKFFSFSPEGRLSSC